MFATRDLTGALLLHILVVAMIMLLNQWQNMPKPMPEHTIQVSMISLQDLQAMMPKPEMKAAPPPAKAPPVTKPQEVSKPKVVEKNTPTPKPKPKPKPKLKVVEDPNYDPFAPLQSTSKTPVKPRVSGEKVVKDLLRKQLSPDAINHYILGMQKAVERQWKVPTETIGQINDALVELTLLPNGQVAKVNVLESSGSALLDQTLLQAIHAAAPFHVPAQQFELFKVNVIRFYPLR